jgi:hypothetical protein
MAGWIALGVLVAVIVLPWALMIRRQWLRGGGGARPMFRERQRLVDSRHGKPGWGDLESFRSAREHKYGIRGRRDAD